jgi:hypothetical protein
MFIVRKSGPGLFGGGGTSYLVEASKSYETKYRLAKVARKSAMTFGTKRTAQTWASRMGGEVVEIAG